MRRNKTEVAKIELAELERVFKPNHGIQKYIAEYREFIQWLDSTYPTFKEDVKSAFWIKRIITMHDQQLVDLSTLFGDFYEEDTYPKDREAAFNIYKQLEE